MSEIVPGQLFLGGLAHAQDPGFIRNNLISGVVSCCGASVFGSMVMPGVEQLRVDVEDISSAPILAHYDAVEKFIDRHVENGGAVLIHCKSGVSRSATLVVAYLVKRRGMTLKEALLFVMSKRPMVCPNIGFVQQLCHFEAVLLDHEGMDKLGTSPEAEEVNILQRSPPRPTSCSSSEGDASECISENLRADPVDATTTKIDFVRRSQTRLTSDLETTQTSRSADSTLSKPDPQRLRKLGRALMANEYKKDELPPLPPSSPILKPRDASPCRASPSLCIENYISWYTDPDKRQLKSHLIDWRC